MLSYLCNFELYINNNNLKPKKMRTEWSFKTEQEVVEFANLLFKKKKEIAEKTEWIERKIKILREDKKMMMMN